ncbi:MAG: hypothetical protein ACKO0M_08335, partial [Cyanobium sp.]
MIRVPPPVQAWLAALGRWRLLFALATALGLAGLGPRLASTAEPPADMAVLDSIHGAIPEALGSLLLRVYQLSG